jgi:A118 family predicted phage portal protein
MDSQVIEFLQSKQISVIQEDIDTKLNVWESWYKGHVDGFHTYQIYSGKKKINKKRRTLNMAQRVCQDWADLLLNEKVKITIADKDTQKVLDELLHQINFFVKGNNLIEAAFAKGGGIFIQYYDGKKVSQKYVTQDFM